MKIISFGITDTGKKREINEDYFALYEDIGLYIVADGMGGHQAGEVASQFAVNRIAQFFQAAMEDNDFTWPIDLDPHLPYEERLIHSAIKLTNNQLYQLARETREYRGMGTTIVGIYLVDQMAYIFNVGDSRAYIIRGQRMRQLSRDHTWVQEQLQHRSITHEEAKEHYWRNIITRALGNNPTIQGEVKKQKIKPKDYFVLCSDGLTNMVPEREIKRIIRRSGEKLQLAGKQLITEANNRGGLDNITAVILYIK